MKNVVVAVLGCICCVFFFAGSLSGANYQKPEIQLKVPTNNLSLKNSKRPIFSSELKSKKDARDPSSYMTAK